MKIPSLGGSGTGRVRPALSRDTASVESPAKIQKANAGASLSAPPLAIQVKPKKKAPPVSAIPPMHKTVANAMLRGV
jgi:hypothetical protein